MRVLYSDGSQGANNLKAGGWACLEVVNGKAFAEKHGAEFAPDVTNNQMELRAAIEAAKMVKTGEAAMIHSDSQYVVKGISEWIIGWQKNNWRSAKKEPVANKEIWLELLESAKGKNIQWIWVRAHANDEFNNRVDQLAKQAYTNPRKISTTLPQPTSSNKKPNVGNIVYFADQSKRYIVVLNDINMNGQLGFLARLLANSLGHELEFFSYGGDKINIVPDRSDAEANLIFTTINLFTEKVKNNFYDLKKSCKHKVVEKCDSAVCIICDKDFGWYCPESKDHTCHYFSSDGKVTLRNGEVVNIPQGDGPNYESYDWCIFCGEPEERK